jgi:hypothetical protein
MSLGLVSKALKQELAVIIVAYNKLECSSLARLYSLVKYLQLWCS